MKSITCILFAFVLFSNIFLFNPQNTFAEETGFRFPTTCETDGSSCENMRFDDILYNSWVNTKHEEVVATFTDFGVPDEAIIDEIKIKMLIRASQSGWTWFTQASVDEGVVYLFPYDCSSLGGRCRYNTTTSFNLFNYYNQDYTLRWVNNAIIADHYVTGEEFNSPLFKLKLVQEFGFKNIDIDAVLYNVLYHMPFVEPDPDFFLDLPWDYEGKGLTFTEAAMAINSYFDHEYPLLSTTLFEPATLSANLITFEGLDREDKSYSSHDGYDYGRSAKAALGDPVLAAASGSATYVKSCKACGNAIHIDHGNGFQTRYYHLLKEGLITDVVEESVNVGKGDKIGEVGSTGRSTGAHIHFMVIQDKNDDGDFDDNIPDGLVDPFGWQGQDPDPWENYSFFYKELDRTGSKSSYLWNEKIDSIKKTVTSGGDTLSSGQYTIVVPEDTVNQNVIFQMSASANESIGDSISSLGSSINITAKDLNGNSITEFNEPITISVDFSLEDLSRFLPETLSIYSSSDKISWEKEISLVDLVNKIATAEINHLSYFALMAERRDTVAPVTDVKFVGDEGQDNWFRSDVQVALNSKDNEGGMGVDYTLYRLLDGDWEIYENPLKFSDEGSYAVEFYSVDNDDNKENIKTVQFNIDKTVPETIIDANPKVIWPPNGKMVDILIDGQSYDDNLLVTEFQVVDEYDLVEPVLSDFGQIIQFQASRRGDDLDGREYMIQVVAVDKAGNEAAADVKVIVPHDND